MNFYQEITLIPQIEIPLSFVLGKLYTQLHLALVQSQDQQGKRVIGVSFPEYRYETRKCDFMLATLPPTKEAIETMQINAMGSYVFNDGRLYFIHKANREFMQLALNDHQLRKFAMTMKLYEMQPDTLKPLVKAQFDEIKSITGYSPSRKGLGNKLRVFGHDETTLHQLNLPEWLIRLNDYVHCTSVRPVPTKVLAYARYHRQRIKGSAEKLARRHAKRHGILFEEAIKQYQNNRYGSDLPYIQLKSLTTQHSFRLLIEKTHSNESVQQGFGTYGLSNFSTVPEF